MPQPADRIQSRILMRAVPCVSFQSFNEEVADGASLIADFDVLTALVDPNFFLAGAAPTAAAVPASGQLLDWTIFSSQIGEANLYLAVDDGCSFRAAMDPERVLASDLFQISGFRVTGRYVRAEFTNTSGAAADVEMSVIVRSQ